MRLRIRTNNEKKNAYESALQHIGNQWRAEKDPDVQFMHQTVYELVRQVHHASRANA